MAKMFYTAEEAAQKLGKTVEEIMAMASSGEIQAFKQENQDMFRVEQVDMLADDDEVGDVDLEIALEDSGEADPLGLSGSAAAVDPAGDSGGIDLGGADIGLEDSAAPNADDSFLAGTGVSAFEGGSNAASGDDLLDDDLSLETVGSGSGLLDLTRESDDTSLGAELIEEVYSSDESGAPASASGLFEAVGDGGGMDDLSAPAAAMAAVPVVVETYEGSWSGVGVGMGIVAVASLILVALMALVGTTGALPALVPMMTSNLVAWAGGLLGGLVVFGLLGFFIGKASE